MAPLSVQWGDLAAASTVVLSLFGVLGLIIRYGLVPYLREQVVKPLHETRREVTGGKHDPSMRDQLDELSGEIEDATLELRAMALMFDGHLEWSQAEVDALWAELKRQRAAGERSPQPRHKGASE